MSAAPVLSVLDAACWYAGMRLHSFPVEPRGKAPIGELVPNGKDDATLDLPTLDRWFRGANGRTPNIGIACGPSDIVVIDIDPRNGGEATFAALEIELGPLPPTWTADTGGGGVHMPFRAPAGAVLVGKLGPGVDLIRNGYIVAPPSVHPSGGIYSWRTGHGPSEVALAELPAPWITRATRRPAEPSKTSKAPRRDDERTIKRARKYLERMEPAIQGQNGSGALFAAVCRMMHGFDLDDGAVRSVIVEDYNPRCDPPWSDREIDHKIREAREKVDAERWRIEDRELKPANMSPEQRSDPSRADANDPRPEITISSDQSATVDAAERALVRMGGIYIRARVIVQVVRDVAESHGLTYPQGAPVIVRLQRERLRELCGQAATWISTRKNKKTGEVVQNSVQCPPWVPATLEQRGEWKLPYLDRVCDTPVLRPDGTIHDRPGYDTATRSIYDPGAVRYPAIPTSPTQADARRAYLDLLEPMCDVLFVDESDKGAWVSLVITLIARSAIDGPTLLHLARATIRGAGKGLVIDVAAIIATGRTAPKRPPVTTEDELRKALFAYALESPAIVVLDNVEGSLGSPTLAAVLTTNSISDRLLGVSENRTAEVRYVIAATGNNVQLRGDLGRRVLPIDLDPRTETPEDRTGFRYPDLINHVRQERPRLVVAVLTILRAYIAAGRPAHPGTTLGSYEAWDRLVRGAIIWSGGADPVAGQKRIREDGDEDAEQLGALLAAWSDTFGSDPVLVSEAVRKATDYDLHTKQLTNAELHDALAAYCRAGVITSRRIGDVMKMYRGRICGGLEIVRHAGRAGSARWAVSPVKAGA